jgi:formate-dependent phosphoribosylglycinamide formyltransferase (GAR transformylase)
MRVLAAYGEKCPLTAAGPPTGPVPGTVYDPRVNIIFVEPFFPSNQREFVRALASVGATVIGIGEYSQDSFDDDLRGWLHHYHQVPSVTDVDRMTEAVRWIQGKVWVDRLEATIEAHTMAAAQVREACGIPGTTVRTAWLCRDKPSMKQALREAGVPTAASTAADSPAQVHSFAEQIGYPLILKPRAGAGASGTVRVNDPRALEQALGAFGADGVDSIAVEEFVEGHEGFYDTIAINGEVAHDFVSHYYPNVLEAMRTRWISPQFIATNRVDSVTDYEQLREMGRRVIAALGIGTSATHMEWFFGPKGLRFSEIGCRPPGVGAWDLYSAGNELDVYREWAHAVVHGQPEGKASRRFAAGMLALRPDQDGTIHGYSGVDEAQRRYGEWVIDAHFPNPGTPTQPVEAGYMANAYVRMRHPDYDALRGMLDDVAQTIRVHAG